MPGPRRPLPGVGVRRSERLDPDGDIEDPSGQDLAVFLSLAARMQGLVRRLIAEMVPA